MNTQGFFDSFKQTVNRRVGEAERKQPTGVVSLIFSGAVFSILGGSYLLKQEYTLYSTLDRGCCHPFNTTPLQMLCAKWIQWTREKKFLLRCMERC